MRKVKGGSCLAAAGLAMSLTVGFVMGTPVLAMAGEQETIVVTYDNLSQLVQNSQDFQNANENYTTNSANYESLLTSLEEEREYMRFLADKYEDDAETEAVYKSNASALSASITQIRNQLERLNNRSNTISREQMVDSYTLTAQNLMNTYNQMTVNVTAKEKSVASAEASYRAALARQSAGMATAADVMAAADTLDQERNQLTSYRQQADQARFSLLTTLGIEDSASVTIGTVPAPDLADVAAVDFETDQVKAVNNNQTVQNVRHSGAGTATELTLKASQEMEAVGNAQASILSQYQQLQASTLEYQAALDAYESAQLAYQSLQRKQQAGMLTQAEYLSGEAAYYEALASKETASMNLTQAWESYRWSVEGIS